MLRAVTIEAAYEYFEGKVKGSIRKAKIADLIVLEKSPLEIDTIKVKDIKVLETYKSGMRVFKN